MAFISHKSLAEGGKLSSLTQAPPLEAPRSGLWRRGLPLKSNIWPGSSSCSINLMEFFDKMIDCARSIGGTEMLQKGPSRHPSWLSNEPIIFPRRPQTAYHPDDKSGGSWFVILKCYYHIALYSSPSDMRVEPRRKNTRLTWHKKNTNSNFQTVVACVINLRGWWVLDPLQGTNQADPMV